MKHYTQLGFIFLLLAMIVILPVAAADVSTSVVLAKGGGAPPLVMAKWETEPGAPSLESGDPTHQTLGSQFLPDAVFNGKKYINYYAVVKDEENNGNVLGAYADVYHPDGSKKYQVHFVQMSKAEGIAAWNAAKDIGIITTPCSCTENSVKTIDTTGCGDPLFELNKGTASVWVGVEYIHYCQPDGNYVVKTFAVDKDQNPSNYLYNTFYYMPVTAAEYDFTGVNYGQVSMGPDLLPKWVAGDTNFLDDDGFPTVRNVGNTRANIIINQDDMGFGKNSAGVWNVRFDARLGHTGDEPLYDPDADHLLGDVLERSHTEEMDFSIHVIKGFEAGKGTMTLRLENPDALEGPRSYCLYPLV